LCILVTFSFGWIIKWPMIFDSLAGKARAGGVSFAANGDNGLDVLTHKLIEMLGAVMADVDANFLHHLHSQRMHMARRITAGTLHIKLITGGRAQDSFSHVAATTVPGTENQHDGLGLRRAQELIDYVHWATPPP
jgi:hypothetical protein